jgi:hypothetical protein
VETVPGAVYAHARPVFAGAAAGVQGALLARLWGRGARPAGAGVGHGRDAQGLGGGPPQVGLALHSRVSDWLHGPYRLSSTGVLTRVVHTPGCQIGYMEHTGCHRLVFLTAK